MAQQQLLAAQIVGGGGGSSSFVGARVFTSVGATIASSGTPTVLSWDSVTFDTVSLYSGGSPTRLTVPVGKTGYWRVSGMTTWGSVINLNSVYAEIHVNGSYKTTLFNLPGATGMDNTYDTTWTTVIHLTAGDYIELAVAQASGSPVPISTGDDSNNFIAEFIGA